MIEPAEPPVAGAALLRREQAVNPFVVGADKVAHQIVARVCGTEGVGVEGRQRGGGSAGAQEVPAG